MFFRKRKKDVKPICIHDWYLIDTKIIEEYNNFDSEFVKCYKIGCVKCNKTKSLDELDFAHFKNTFVVKNI